MYRCIRIALIAGILAGSVTESTVSDKRLAKMSQHKKDKQLLFYASKAYPKPSVYTLRSLLGGASRPTFPIFEPAQMYLDKILDLIKHGASVNVNIPYYWMNKVGGSGTFKPIYLFIKSNNIEATRLLLAHGARIDNVINFKDRQYSGLAFATTKEMAELLISYGAFQAATNAKLATI